ncbi:MAG: hypothetical protein H6Q33_225 [Deltaproteobacteria bacterium]|nr:hypothetical protein [Deltaproteobacteria bacterium]
MGVSAGVTVRVGVLGRVAVGSNVAVVLLVGGGGGKVGVTSGEAVGVVVAAAVGVNAT